MGNLFYRQVPPSEIKNMTISEMQYWNEWHNVLVEEKIRQNKEYEKALKGK